ncbi:extracellular solute-binding protein [Paenibacillus aurantius]|uniref:Extracellular solute-binding protein n=2 Tax=Paenibacillus aurantius TaxID=2918900 RepID=A0AA96RKB0_9BACL|nr:extracellular solute-binding protein [Paenibacillus aurantius]WNQ14204.1 extracellular solute-binding protein [Paenibacillus aurantius]
MAGCGGSEPKAGATTAPTANGGLDTSEKVELQLYMLGEAPKDLPVIEGKINEMALKDLNATVKFNYIPWTDNTTKYKLLLTSGQNIDLIYTANWFGYQQYAKKGAFQPLDELVPKYAPKLNSFVPKDMWETARIDGKIYTVPSTYKEYTTGGFIYREDLRQKYNLPKPDSIETFGAYLDGIKKNEKDLFPLASGFNMNNYKELKVNPAGSFPYGVTAPYTKPQEMTSFWGSPEHLAGLKVAKEWADKGFWSKNVLNEKELANNLVINGKSAALMSHNPSMFNDMNTKTQAGHPDWKLAYSPFPFIKGYATPVNPIGNGFAIPKSSKHADRAIAFYEKLVTDKRYNQLTEYGIEGTNYKVENGYYQMIGDAKTNGFPREAMNGWSWRNPEYMLFDKGYDGVKEIFSQLDKISKPDIYSGFAEDYTSYQAEKAALEQVEKQYLKPLEMGLVDDVEGGLKIFMEKAKAAGLEKIQAEYKKQWLQYLDEKKIK